MTVLYSEHPTLSHREEMVLSFIEEFVDANGLPPAIREIMEGTGLSSTSLVSYNLRKLEKKGYINILDRISRGIQLANAPQAVTDKAVYVVQVPLLRRIIRRPRLGIPETDLTQTVPLEWLKGTPPHEVYAVELYSERLYDALVNLGDVAIIHNTEQAMDGDTVLVWMRQENAMRVRRIYREGKEWRLEPLLKPLREQYVSPCEVQILGRVLGMMREF